MIGFSARTSARIGRFVAMMRWCFIEAWNISPVKVLALILAGIASRLSHMGGFIIALLSINLVVSRQHRAQLLQHYGLTDVPEFAVVLLLTAVVAGTFLVSVSTGLWKRQVMGHLTDRIAKHYQKALFARFKKEASSLENAADAFAKLYSTYSQGLERRLLLALKAASGHVIDVCMNLVSLSLTLVLLFWMDVVPFILVLAILAATSLIYLLASHRQRHAQETVRHKAYTTRRERLTQLKQKPQEIRSSEFWAKVSEEHEKQLAEHLDGVGHANRFYSSMRGWSIGRILSNPAVLAPITATAVFTGLILHFFERSQTDSIDLHLAILIVFVVRFALSFGNAVAMDLRRFSERYPTVALCHRIAQGQVSVLDSLSAGKSDQMARAADAATDLSGENAG